LINQKTSNMNADKNPIVSGQVRQLRMWPGVVIVIIQWCVRFIIPAVTPEDIVLQLGIFGGLLGGLAVFVWWAFFSRAARIDRWGAIGLMIAALVVTSFFLDKSIKTAMMGMMFVMYSIPVLSLAFVIGVVATHRFQDGPRRMIMVSTILLSCGVWLILRTDGMTASARHDFAFRWAKTAEDRLLAKSVEESLDISMVPGITNAVAEWPGFRGTYRDGVIYGVRIKTDWTASPPEELWRNEIGPGCSSFAVNGNLFYTQEQRGEYEIVSCYNLYTGKPVWKHQDKARFYDSHAGAGPRSTPTLSEGCVYTLGATGILNALNASDGSVIWSCNAASDNGVEVLPWGFTGSPLVMGDIVILSLSGKLAAYDLVSGKLRWSGPDGGNSYSSPHMVTIEGVPQIILMSQSGAISLEPSGGKQLWNYSWPLEDRILQPAVIAEGDLLIAGEISGLSRISVSHVQDQWEVKEIWKSSEMILNFNDIVIHKGYVYGFNGPRIACMNITDGKLQWQGAPYRGWLLLLADQDLLLVLSEKGVLSLVNALPGKFIELAKLKAIEGKTWNHPVLVGDILLVRNNTEMAAFRLQLAES
jgi:outer membrane protein assembly factor BamB